MTIRLSIKWRSLIVAVLVTLGLLISTFAFLTTRDTPLEAQTKYYSSQLLQLKADVQTIDLLNSHEHGNVQELSLTDQVKRYDNTLSHVLSTCRSLQETIKNTRDDPMFQSLKPNTALIDELCTDLRKVTDYALRQSNATKSFLTYSGSSLKSIDDLPKFQGVLNTTKLALEKLKQDSINDPAVSEQLILLQELHQKSQDSSVDTAKINELSNKIQEHQANFLNARNYYWKNTVGIDDLNHSLNNLEDNVKN